MNKRIKELAVEAGLAFRHPGPGHISADGRLWIVEEVNVYDNFAPDKFGELIIDDIVIAMRDYAGILEKTGSKNGAFVLRTYASRLIQRYKIK